MAPGSFNGKNYGGLHSGCGKKQKKGVYTLNGYNHKDVSHKYFRPGREVMDIKTGYVGIIEEHNEGPRTLKKIYFPSMGETKYIYTNLLILKKKNIKSKIIEQKQFTEKQTEKYNKYLEKKKNDTEKRRKEKEEKREERINMRKAKKLLRQDINKNIVFGKSDYNLLKSNSNIVNEINKDRYLKIKNLKEKNKFKLSQDKLMIVLNKLTQDGSTEQLCLNISNRNDYLNLVKKYMKEML
tara:strand:+ start:861 stop:1577 length:717 start_codon:yes stop_codon:yes gene_type:complete